MNKIHILICLSIFAEIGYSLLAPLYPFLAKQRHVSDTMIGVVFSSFAISNFLLTFLSPTLIATVGRQKLLIASIIIEGLCTCLFGLLSYISSYSIFILISFILRLAQGGGGAIIQILIYTLATSNSTPKDIEMNLGYIELGFTAGLTLGPFLASVGYHFFGYTFPFLVAGVLELGLLYLVPCLDIEEDLKTDEDQTNNILSILTNKNIFLTFMAPMIDMISLSFIYPVFAPHLHAKYGLSPEATSLFFIFESVTYFVALQSLNQIGKHFGNRVTIALGTLVNALSILLLAPNPYFPQDIYVVLIGLGGLGIAGAMISIPAAIDLIKTMKDELHLSDQIAQDYSGAIFNLSYFIGETLGPLLGGSLTERYKFDKACNVNAQMNILFSIVYFIWIVYTRRLFNREKELFIESEGSVMMYSKLSEINV